MSDDLFKRMFERRMRLLEEGKAIIEFAESENRDLTPEESTKWEKVQDEVGVIDKRTKELQDFALSEKEIVEARSEIDKIAKTDRTPDVSYGSDAYALRYFRGEIEHRGGIEMSLTSVGAERRDYLEGSTSAGGYTVPTTFMAELYQHLVVGSAIRRTNARVLQTASGEPMTMPKTLTNPTAAVVGEGSAIPENDGSFGQVTISAFKYAISTQISTELTVDSGVNLLSWIASATGDALARETGAKYILGTGTNQPQGVMVACGTGVTGGTGATGIPSADNLIDLYYSVIEPYRVNGYFLMGDSTMAGVRKLKDTTNNYLYQPSLVLGTPDMLLGRPIVTDPNIAATGTGAMSVCFGDFSRFYIIRDAGSIRFERSDDYAFINDLVTFRTILRTDGRVVDLTGAVKGFKGGAS